MKVLIGQTKIQNKCIQPSYYLMSTIYEKIVSDIFHKYLVLRLYLKDFIKA